MSNNIAGEIFEKVIQEVIAASQNDFEENGVQQQTLSELQQSWQHKLSQRGIAQMPWDPKPAPPPPTQSQQPTPSPITAPAQNGAPMQHQPPNGQAVPNGQPPRIKAEPGQEPQQMQNYPAAQGYAPQMNAQARAASLLHQRYGTQANASLDAMQQRGIALPPQNQGAQQQQQQARPPQGLQLPGQPGGQPSQVHQQQLQQQQQQRQMQQQYAQTMRNQTAYQQPQIKTEGNGQYAQPPPGQQNGVNYSQTDGVDEAALDEWNIYIAQRRQLTAVQVSHNDHMMRDEVEAITRGLENGLMQPLSQQKQKSRRSRQRKTVRGDGQASPSLLPAIPQLDGDAEEEDEDAINSDLDSSGDEAGKEDEDEEEIDSMLCTYDKVQRVKNKWKCTLKDGILLANGKEYLFHKAQGEFEW